MNKLLFTRTGNKIITAAVVLFGAAVFLLKKITGWSLLTSILPPCYFHLATGYNCPGCGGTRAVIALSHLDFKTAFWYNPLLVLLFAIMLIWFIGFVKNAFIGTYKIPFKSRYYIIFGVSFAVLALLFMLIRNTHLYQQLFY